MNETTGDCSDLLAQAVDLLKRAHPPGIPGRDTWAEWMAEVRSFLESNGFLDLHAPNHLCGGGARCDTCGTTYDQFTRDQAAAHSAHPGGES